MKKHEMLAITALIILFSCSKESLNNTDRDSLKLEKSSLYGLTGEQQSRSPNSAYRISFICYSIAGDYVDKCLPPENLLLKHGTFSGNITGYGKINPSLSTYEFVSCSESNTGGNLVYAVVAEGRLALSSKDQCNITITGNIYAGYYPQLFYGGNFIGTAITTAGTGKLLGFNNKSFEVLSGNLRGPSINLETGTIDFLRISEIR